MQLSSRQNFFVLKKKKRSPQACRSLAKYRNIKMLPRNRNSNEGKGEGEGKGEKERAKRRKGGEEKKAIVALLVFIIATLEIVFGGQQEYNTIN